MGYKSGPAGVKEYLKSAYGSSFARAPSHASIVTSTGTRMSAALVDFMIIMMGAPASCAAYTAFLNFAKRVICSRMQCTVLALLIDEPDAVPGAKKAEQDARDASQQLSKKARLDGALCVVRSADLDKHATPVACTADFDSHAVQACTDCIALVRNRQTRYRFIDHLFDALLADQSNDGILHHAKQVGCTLLIDGMDVRGARRPASEPRQPDIVCTDHLLAAQLRRTTAVGESDMKMVHVDRALRRRVVETSSNGSPWLIMWDSTDTDEIGIAMLYVESLQNDAVASLADCATTLLTMRERGGGAPNTRYERPPSTYLVVDPACLVDCIIDDVLARRCHGTESNWLCGTAGRLYAVRTMVAAFALAGCDFVEKTNAAFKGNVLTQAAIARLASLDMPVCFVAPVDGGESTPPPPLLEELRAICEHASCITESTANRYRLQHSSCLSNVELPRLQHAAWAVRYWECCKPPEGCTKNWGF